MTKLIAMKAVSARILRGHLHISKTPPQSKAAEESCFLSRISHSLEQKLFSAAKKRTTKKEKKRVGLA